MKKQYIIEYETYSGNDKITKYQDGKVVDSDINNDYTTPCRCRMAESEGYERAIHKGELEEEIRRLKEELQEAEARYAEAERNRTFLIGS